jgi:ribosomal protein S18 acetylase RimI-like enzyme
MPEFAPPMTADERRLWERVTALWAMSARGDDAGIADALHPDYAGWDPSMAAPHDREAAVRSAGAAAPRLLDHTLEPLSVRTYEGTSGVAHYRYAATVDAGGGAVRRVSGCWTEAYALSDGRWRLVAVGGRPDPAPAAMPGTAALEPADLRMRLATAVDATSLRVLGTQVFLDTYATDGIRPTLAREALAAFSEEALAAALNDPAVRLTVAERKGHLIGFAHARLGPTQPLAPGGAPAELCHLYVQPRFAGLGVGGALLAVVERQAAAAGCTVLWLTAWRHNERALSFYARHGFRDVGTCWHAFEDERYENRVLAKSISEAAGA